MIDPASKAEAKIVRIIFSWFGLAFMSRAAAAQERSRSAGAVVELPNPAPPARTPLSEVTPTGTERAAEWDFRLVERGQQDRTSFLLAA
jgi:hypothetical protein